MYRVWSNVQNETRDKAASNFIVLVLKISEDYYYLTVFSRLTTVNVRWQSCCLNRRRGAKDFARPSEFVNLIYLNIIWFKLKVKVRFDLGRHMKRQKWGKNHYERRFTTGRNIYGPLFMVHKASISVGDSPLNSDKPNNSWKIGKHFYLVETKW